MSDAATTPHQNPEFEGGNAGEGEPRNPQGDLAGNEPRPEIDEDEDLPPNQAYLFGLAECDEETGEPDPDLVRMWGMDTPDGVVLFWREWDGRSNFATFDDAMHAERRFGRLFDLRLVWT